MYPGRSVWARGVLALGVGALFLLGWRIDSTGDALSASTPIDSDRNYFSVDVASFRSSSRHSDHGKKEEWPRDESGTGRQDRQASGRDYSARDQETWTPSDVHRNVELDGEHEASISAEANLPPSNLERDNRLSSYLHGTALPSENSEEDIWKSGDRGLTSHSMTNLNTLQIHERDDGVSDSYLAARSLPIDNFQGNNGESTSYLNTERGDNTDKLKAKIEKDSFTKNEGNHGPMRDVAETSFALWNLERINDKKDGGSKSHFVETPFPSWNFDENDQENDDRGTTSYSATSSSPLRNVERNDGGSKNYIADKSFPLWNLERKGEIKDERDGSLITSIEKLVPFTNTKGNGYTESENDWENRLKITENKNNYKLPQNPTNHVKRSTMNSRSRLFLSNLKMKYGSELISYSYENNYESMKDPIIKKKETYSKENSLPPSNLEKINLTENNHESTENPIKKKNDFASLEDPNRRVTDDEGNYTVFRIEEAGTLGEQDESRRFSKDDEETQDGLNGLRAGERSDVKENLSREVNGQSMNEIGKSLRQSYYSNVGNDRSITLHEELGENDDETDELQEMESTTVSLEQYSKLNSKLQNTESFVAQQHSFSHNLSSNLKRSLDTSDERRNRNILSINNNNQHDKSETAISIDRRSERNANVGDFHNSDRLYGFSANADREEGYKRGQESISGSVDPPAATRRLFFHEDHWSAQSSAKTSKPFRSRKGRVMERDRGNILESGTRETRSRDRLPEATDSSVDFREIDTAHGNAETFDGHRITDRKDRADVNEREIRSESSKFRGSKKLFDERIAKVSAKVSDKLAGSMEGFGNEEFIRELNLYNDNKYLKVQNGERKFELDSDEKLVDFMADVQKLENYEITKASSPMGGIQKVDSKLNLQNEFSDILKGLKHKKSSNLLKTLNSENTETSEHSNFYNVPPEIEKYGAKLLSQNEKSSNFLITARDFKDIEKSKSTGLNLHAQFLNKPQFGVEVKSKDRKGFLRPGNKLGVRRKRYTNYYSPQSVTPMAYVHIQPAYPVPAAPSPNRKCVHCMVVYKPCPSPPRSPPMPGFPMYKYQELASKWRGLKYGCRCNPVGSITSACDIVTGQCQCKPHVIGRQCDQCMVGFWGLTTGAECGPCGCDPIGSHNSSCHDILGQCYCKPGVGGILCDTCLSGYYGFSSNGCQVCDQCIRPGHICDPDTGRCVCPPLTFGEHCDRCRPGSWDLIPGVGCRSCECTLGSTRSICDHQGQCPCRIGYAGLRCERCAKGYYGYPRCRPCNCNLAGTLQCNNEICDCNDKGQCPCKEYAVGRQCSECKDGTFGLAVNNPKGCTECFCFGRTTSCQQAGLSWGQRRLTRPRTLYINDTSNDIIVSKFRSQIFLSPINGGLNITNRLSTIPDIEGDVTIPSNLYYNYPLYWMLPPSFLGDKVVSYGGFLRFTTLTEGGIPLRSTFQYPIVQLQGNDKIVLEYYLPAPTNDNRYDVRFHESLWQLQNRPDYKVTREVFMVALQNLQYILVKASDNAEFTKTTLLEASLDAAILTPAQTPLLAMGVEICQCPPQYNNTSCQDPSIGYYRCFKNTTVTSTIVIDLIGEASPCQCNGRSEICDIETGHCLNCRGNTAGPRCEICADSFYGHPDFGCKPCPCPQADKRFSNTCMVFADTEPICVCKPGYTGRKCERCSSGYYGLPHLPDGKCIPCNCNPAGSLSDACNTETGQCRCRAGSTGRDCYECTAYRHVYTNNVCTSCNDNCTGVLLNTVSSLSQELAKGTVHIAKGYIPPPWEELSYIDINATMFLEEINTQNELQKRMKAIPRHDYRKLLKHVETLLRTANEHVQRAGIVKSKSNDLKNNIFSAKIEMDNLRKHIEDTVLLLDQYSNDNKRIEIKKALKMAKMILNSLKAVNLTKKTMEIENFLKDVAKYTDWLNSLYDPTERLAIAQDNTKDYSVKLTDMRNIIETTMETLFTYDGLYNSINQTLLEARNHCNEIKMVRNTINESITETQKLTKEARGFIIDLQKNIRDLPELRNKLTYWFVKLSMKEEQLYRLNYEYNDTYVIPAVAHVKNLSNYVDQYVSLFSETRNIAASPLKASQAYKNIVDNIRTANITAMAAKDIAEDMYNKTFPDGPTSKSLLDSAKEISLMSSKQRDNAKQHEQLVQNAADGLELQKQAANISKSTLNTTEIRDNQINVELQNLQNDSKKLQKSVQNILNDTREVLDTVETTQKLIEDYEQGISERLKPKLYELKREGDTKISLASEKLTEVLNNIKKADAKLISSSNAATERQNMFDKCNKTLATKLQNLKNKIAEARNIADGIRVSLRSAEGKECSRSYRPSTLQATSTNTIVMTFARLKGKKDGSLFYLPSSINDDFLALEMVDKKVRFVWNVGGGTGIAIHNETIRSGDLQNDRFWYRIEAERVRNLGKLHVRKQASTIGENFPVTNSTDPEYGRFDITTSDRVWIGKIPRSERRRTELVASNGLPVCVHQVILDGKPIGLWNFITTAPDMACKACVEGVEDARDDIAYSFNGEGYAIRNRVSSRLYNKYSFEVSINFRTYDENALLFLAINPENDQHIMIFLKEGKVILHIGYGGNISMEMSSNFKYNTGNWTKVDAFRHYQTQESIEKCRLSVGEADERIGAPTPQPNKEDIPDLVQPKYYIGGIPPSFRSETVMLPKQVSFLGCMSNIIVEEGYDPMAEQYYGVEPTCVNKPLKVVGFYGDGYLQHSAYTLRKMNYTVSFSFRTMQEEAVLLLSTFEGQEERMPNIRHMNNELNKKSYYSVCIINGQVQVRLNAGRGELVLQSNETFNDGRYHSITIIKRGKDVELRIDDAYQSAGKLPTNAAIRAPEGGGGLFFGGLPVLINNTNMIATVTPLYGAIKDTIFNDQIIRFDEATNFEHALIGRSGPSMGKDIPIYTPSASLSRGMSTEPEGCQKVPYYSLEAGALKFGDKPNSHTQLYLNFKKFWEKKYAIEFDFRTYYPNGLLFITPGLRPKHYLMVVIRDGQLLLLVKSKQKKEILFKTPFNDGNWHHVMISHDERKLTLLVDSQTPRTIKVPRKIGLASMMYIGGLPESGTPIPEQVVVKLETLKGCIRGLKINGNVYDMVGSTSRAYQVGQCFPNVESGAYFQDEAFAIYKRNFELGAVLELQLEFRTSELSGVLLSITAPGNSPSLSLELNNGKVIMSGDLGDNNPLYVEQRFTSPYTICDNRWHRIQAVYNDEELALKVDEMDQKYGLPANVNYHIMDSTVSGPLYIGGLPASAPKGTLITRDHFNGCIRNVMIGGERRDWTDMDELHNIHLSSCPVQ